jgi:hypothetical protein
MRVKFSSGNISFWESSYQPRETFGIDVFPPISSFFLGNLPLFGILNGLLLKGNDYLTIWKVLIWLVLLSFFIFLYGFPCAPDPASGPLIGFSGNGGWGVVASMRRVTQTNGRSRRRARSSIAPHWALSDPRKMGIFWVFEMPSLINIDQDPGRSSPLE